MKNTKIEKIINEIMSIDEDMKKYEKEIRSIAYSFSKSKPDLEINDSFKNNLKNKIMKEINKIKKDKKEEEKKVFNWMIFSKKLAFSLGAIVLLIAIIIPLKNNLEKNDGKLVLNNKQKQEQTDKFVRVEDGAFGKIAISQSSPEENQDSRDLIERPNLATSEETSGGDSSVSVLGMGAGSSKGIVADSSRIMPYPYEAVNYEFKYVGEDFELNGEKVDVYKKIAKDLNSLNLTSTILNSDFDIIDLNNFKKGAKLSSITLNQDTEYGYTININPEEGSISLYTNWKNWPQPYADCNSGDCYQENRLDIKDIPEDEKIIEVANNFLNDNGIDLSEYANGLITDDLKARYEEAENKENVYIPDQISVTYPLVIDGNEVVSNNGSKTGLFVSVNIREMKVQSLHNLNANNYQVSAYKAITDKNEILDYVKEGGIYPNYKNPNAEKTVTIEIGTPTKTLVKTYKYNSDEGRSDEFFVPALSFPILDNSSDTRYYRDYIVIPLADEMIEKNINSDPITIMEDMAR